MNWAVERARKLRKESSPNVFGVILFTERHANLRRVLHDRFYWDALDELSGDSWQIFATVAAPGNWGNKTYPQGAGLPEGSLLNMQQVWLEPSENKGLLRDFQLDDSSCLPSLLVFGESQAGEVFRLTVHLNDSSTEQAFASLKGAIRAVTGALDDIHPENFSNVEGVFAAIDLSVTSHIQFRWIKRILPLVGLLAKISKGIS